MKGLAGNGQSPWVSAEAWRKQASTFRAPMKSGSLVCLGRSAPFGNRMRRSYYH
jgi:hypothetical protein